MITPGISEAFAAEIARRGDYVRTVVLNSPGGSVNDALTMGRLIREKKFTTEVEAGKYCASSCPLVFAGGIERRAGASAAIGVHQVAAFGSANAAPRDEMDAAQRISARCQRYLGEMGINLQVWVHAMETPHDRLFVFDTETQQSRLRRRRRTRLLRHYLRQRPVYKRYRSSFRDAPFARTRNPELSLPLDSGFARQEARAPE